MAGRRSQPPSRYRMARCISAPPSSARRRGSTGPSLSRPPPSTKNRDPSGRRPLRWELRRLGAVVHAVVPQDRSDAQAIIAEYPGPAFSLRCPMLLVRAPTLDRSGITPERQRQDLAFVGQALEPLDRDETVDFFEFRPQLRGHLEIILPALRDRLDLEDHRVHGSSRATRARPARPRRSPAHSG